MAGVEVEEAEETAEEEEIADPVRDAPVGLKRESNRDEKRRGKG